MLNPSPAPPSHEDLFVQRYRLLLAWSRKLTNHNQQMAEDLLHDVFVQFTLARPDLGSIQNIDGYLYTMLRNRHLSAIRRTARAPVDQLSSAEYDSAEIRLRSTDLRDHLRVRDELRTICRYACSRKQTSRAGSILILRYFLGYYPAEIVQIAHSSRQAIDSWLRIARTEAQEYLENPAPLAFPPQPGNHVALPSRVHPSDDLLIELRSAIFESCVGNCPSLAGLQQIYIGPSSVGTEVLAHIVSCAGCLDTANSLLGLPPLQERYPVDTVGRDKGPRDGDGGGAIPGPGPLNQGRRKSRQVYEHSPSKLSISVNGFIVGTQSISSETSEVTLNINLDEKVGFVEVYSEQGILLLGLDVEPPPEGPPEQSARIDLSDDRSLELEISFVAAWPSVRVLYKDPALGAATVGALTTAEAAGFDAIEPQIGRMTQVGVREPERETQATGGWKNWIRRWLDLLPAGFWFRPATITAAFTIVLIAALLLVRLPVPAVSAAALLDRASESENLLLAKPDTAVHRTLTLEARDVNRNVVISRRKIETWRNSAAIDGRTSARRLYDEQGTLVAGEFVDLHGSITTYGSPSEPGRESADSDVRLMGREIWRNDPSAASFRSLIGDSRSATVAQDSTAYYISFDNEHRSGPQELVKGSLTLAKPALHVTEERIQLRRGQDLLEYRFFEETFEQVKPAVVPAGVFKADPVLIPVQGSAPGSGSTPAPGPVPRAGESVTASADLEVEVEYLLDGVKANQGEQVSVTRTPDNKLLVKGIVETESRKARILEALGSVAHNPAVNIDISTVDEMARRQKSSTAPMTLQRLDIEAGGRIPVYPELRRYLIGRGISEDRLDEEIRRFSARVLQDSAEALRHAWALSRLAEQMSRTGGETLGSEARSKQLVMIKQHASSCFSAYETLRRELEPVLPAAANSRSSPLAATIDDETDLARKLRQLVAQAGAADAGVRSAFTISSATAESTHSTARFWEPLNEAQALASSIARFANDRRGSSPNSPGE